MTRMTTHEESDDADPRLLGILLRVPYQALMARVHVGLTEAGYDDIRFAHLPVFQHIRPEGSRASALAAQAQVTKQAMGVVLDHLEAHGYVERVPDPSDGRAQLVRLTERGWGVKQTSRILVQRLEADWGTRLGHDRLRQLSRLLKDLVAVLDN